MKMRSWFLLGCLWWAVWPLVSYAEPSLEFLERFPTGAINWTRGVVTATGSSSPQDINDRSEKGEKFGRAYQKAAQNLGHTLTQLRMNYQNCILDLFSGQARIREKVEEMTSAAKIVRTNHNPDGSVEVTLEMNLYGGFAQLVLPSEIRQVESIKPLNNTRPNQNRAAKTPGREPDQNVYSGLIVDARGIGASPSMVPVLVDENDQEVYGPAYVSREFAVQYGMCTYLRAPGNSSVLPRVAPNPLTVKGLRVVSAGSCHIVISNSDAAKLRGISSHLEFLKQCRVVIIID